MSGGAFSGPKGQLSSRRIIAFLYAVAGIAAGGWTVFKEQADWKVIAVAFGIPALVSIVLLLFTTWSDLNDAIKAARGKDDN